MAVDAVPVVADYKRPLLEGYRLRLSQPKGRLPNMVSTAKEAELATVGYPML